MYILSKEIGKMEVWSSDVVVRSKTRRDFDARALLVTTTVMSFLVGTFSGALVASGVRAYSSAMD